MSIGKYLTNLGVLGAVAAAYSTARQTKQMPTDWRRYVVWGVWAAGVLLAVAAVSMQDQDPDEPERVRRLP